MAKPKMKVCLRKPDDGRVVMEAKPCNLPFLTNLLIRKHLEELQNVHPLSALILIFRAQFEQVRLIKYYACHVEVCDLGQWKSFVAATASPSAGSSFWEDEPAG